MLKSKSSRWLAGPYLLWMSIFIIVPLFIVIWYALTNSEGQFTLDNLTIPQLRDMLGYANRAASWTTSRSGAIPAMPTAEEMR